MKRLIGLTIAAIVFVIGCDDVGTYPGPCQDSVRVLTPNPATSANEHICSRGAKLKITDKDTSIVALCRCPETTNPTASGTSDAGPTPPEEKK